MISKPPVYASFGQRFAAMLIDNLLFGIALAPVLLLFFERPSYSESEIKEILSTQGPLALINPTELLFQQAIILCLTIFFWIRFTGTPGKRLMQISLVDATSYQPLTIQQSIMRYLGYFISAMPMGMGFLWVFMDDKNQGWHDKISHTVVIKTQRGQQPSHSSASHHNTKNPQDNDHIFTA